MRVAALVAGADLAAAGSTAVLLWLPVGAASFTGAVTLQVVAFLLCAGLLALRQRPLRTVPAPAAMPVRALLLGLHIVVLGLLILGWVGLDVFLLGWAAFIASGLLATGSVVQAIGAVRAPGAPLSLLLPGGGIVVGLAGLAVTTPVHLWAGGVVDTILVMDAGAVVLALVVTFWTASLTPTHATS